MNEEASLLFPWREEIYAELRASLAPYRNKTYLKGSVTEAQNDRAALHKIENAWKNRRRQESELARAETEMIEEIFAEGISMIEDCLAPSAEILHDWERDLTLTRRAEIRALVRKALPDFDVLADRIFDSPAFISRAWLKSNIKPSVLSSEVVARAQRCREEIGMLLLGSEPFSASLLSKYLETMDLQAVAAYRSELEALSALLPADAIPIEDRSDRRVGAMTVRLSGTIPHLTAAQSTLSLLGLQIQVIESAMPKPPQSVDLPCFSDFISIDLETTGSLGSKSGDAPAAIMEIGAVKVIGGEIVDRLTILCNPGRNITPYCEALTHITNEMVRDQPPVAEGIRMLCDFASDLPWIGHDLLHNDLPLLIRAASPAGIVLSPICFDTFAFALSHKDALGYPGLSLEALAAHYSIGHGTLHRATEDAEVGAKVYLRMRDEAILETE